ncbi:MAG: Calx-beta domain-containing protein [Verrucomicrobiota bacterium JB023]|nr:Calx-beta domain-containing protein [Verrucomicrobiota bacterium JB023]
MNRLPSIFCSLLLFSTAFLSATPQLSVTAAPTNEGLIGLPVTFTLSEPAAGGERFVFDMIDGTATAEADFIPFSNGVVEFPAGSTNETIYLTLIDDLIPEADETFQLALSQPTGLTLPSGPIVLTIVNDDEELTFTSVFSDGMVLQREKGAPLWGFASPGSEVTVTFGGRTWEAIADADSRFEVILDNLPASSQGQTLIVTSGSTTRTFSDVLVGEVWLGAGQSNMDFQIGALPSAENTYEVENANDPQLRYFRPVQQARAEPQPLLDGTWLKATPGDTFDFAALPYYFGKRLREELDVPVAIIGCAWGGQPIQGFVTEEKLLTFPEGVGVLGEKETAYGYWQQAVADYWDAYNAWQANPEGPEPEYPTGDPQFEANLGGQLYNGMVAPHVGYGLRGIIWGQGEANTFGFSSNDYRELFIGLVEDWRARWNEELPFYYVQLPNFVSESRPGWVTVQNEQRLALASLARSGMAITNDIGDPDDIHPANKSAFANRLSLLALAYDYGQPIPLPSGPIYRGCYRQGASLVIEFDHATGLTTRDGQAPAGFELKSEDGAWLPATAILSGNNVIVSSDSIAEPTAVRYAWSPNPVQANLTNEAGLPTSVFEGIPGTGATINTVTASTAPVNEGLIGLPVTFTLSQPAEGGEYLIFKLEDDTAISGEDYQPWDNGYVEFQPGEISQTVTLTLIDDANYEPDETLRMTFLESGGLQLVQTSLSLTIANDDAPANPTNTVTITSSPVNEGLIGFPVTFELSEPANGDEYLIFNLTDGTAVAGEDYLSWANGYVGFSPGQTSQTLWLTVLDDTLFEPNETFTMSFTEAFALKLTQEEVTLTIVNDDAPPASQNLDLTLTSAPTNEGLVALPVTFTLAEPALGVERVIYSLTSSPSDTAEEGIDYLPLTDAVLDFPAGETSQTIYLTIQDDPTVEADETFTLTVTEATGINLPANPLTVTILNDDTVLDEFGATYGLSPIERSAESDGDADGISFLLEYAFNLDPTESASPSYTAGELDANGDPFGLPTLITETDPSTGEQSITYTYIRRTNTASQVDYIPEICADGENFTPTETTTVTPLNDDWEQVELVIGGSTLPDTPSCFARVRLVYQY